MVTSLVDIVLVVEEETLAELIERVRDEIDPLRRKRLRERLAARVREVARRSALAILEEIDADDVAQDVTLKVEPYLLEDDIDDPEAYVAVAARRSAIDRSQTRNRRLERDRNAVDEPTLEPDVIAEDSSPEQQAALQEALKSPKLHPRYRTLLEQVYLQKIPIETLVDELMEKSENSGKSRSTVRNSQIDKPLSRARKRLVVLAQRIPFRKSGH